MNFKLPIELFSPQYCFAQPNLRGDALCYAVPLASHLNSQFQSMCMVRSPKSITEAVEVALGNAPYKIAIAMLQGYVQ
jgi:hypothetical protein